MQQQVKLCIKEGIIYILEINDPKNYKFAEIGEDDISIVEPAEKNI